MSLDARIRIVATGLQKLGVPQNCTVPMAYGVVHMLWRSTWSRATDVLGEPTEIEERCGWQLPTGSLVPLLTIAGFIHEEIKKGLPIYYDVYALAEASESTRKRWRRTNASSYVRASSRSEGAVPVEPMPVSAAPPPPPPPPPEPVVEEKPKDLFGNVIETPDDEPAASSKGPKNVKPKTAHPELIEHWCERWNRLEGSKYPFTARDAKHLSDLLKHSGGLDAAKHTIDAYLACTEKWYAGHPLGKLINDLPKFKSRRFGPYGSGCEGLRSDRKANVGDPNAVLRDLNSKEADPLGNRPEIGDLPF